MPNYSSPGVYTVEKDISDYTPSINTSIVAVVGFAGKGPTNVPTLITSQANLVRTFGQPTEDLDGQAIEGALEILEQTNQLYFVRAAASTAVDASGTVSLGTCPALLVSGSSNFRRGFGILHPLTLRVQSFDNDGNAQYADNNGAGKDFIIPVGTQTESQGRAIHSIVGGDLDADKVGFEYGAYPNAGLGLSGILFAPYAGSGAYLEVSACSSTSFDAAFGTSALRPMNPLSSTNDTYGVSGTFTSACRVYGSTYLATGTDSASYHLESLYPGEGYNGGTKTDGSVSGNAVRITPLGNQNFSVVINENGAAQETFKASLIASGSFLEDIINTGLTNLTSEIIKGNLLKDGVDATVTAGPTFLASLAAIMGDTSFQSSTQWLDPQSNPNGQGTAAAQTGTTDSGGILNKLVEQNATSLAGGTNGTGTEDDNATALIGDSTVDPKTGMQSLDDPVLNIGIALVPGVQTQSVQNALITLAETTQNFLALVSPPYAVGNPQAAINWTNGKDAARTTAINSSYAAVHWPWVKVFSTFDSKDRWYDPSIFAARQMAFTDSIADSWFAPAGFQRGRLTKPSEVEVKLNQGDRDSLYSGGNVVNPIVAFPQQGITIFGQRTTQREPTALDRINVRRLMIYIRKIILVSTQRFVFEPNDEFTWAQIEGVMNPFLDDIRRRRGISEFRVVCDETTNTPVRVDRNELWTKVIVKPTKTAEILVFEINLTNQSADLGTL